MEKKGKATTIPRGLQQKGNKPESLFDSSQRPEYHKYIIFRKNYHLQNK